MRGRGILMRLCFLWIVLHIALVPAQVRGQTMTGAPLYLLAATMSTAAYSGAWQEVLRDRLTRADWHIASYGAKTEGGYGRMYLYSKEMADGVRVYVLAFPGTERLEDVRADLRFARVPFGGHTAEEFLAWTKREDMGKDVPLVHKGFNAYVQAALFTEPLSAGAYAGMTPGEAIASALKEHPKGHLYVTGHSLGGAVATLAAARLSDMGVAREQLTVVTFGAPAVGNKVFAAAYEGRFHLMRVEMEGDVIKALLQSPLGYTRFGEVVRWKENAGNQRFAHDMVLYQDAAIRQYYDSGDAHRMVAELIGTKERKQRIALAPVEVQLDPYIKGDAVYMKKAVQEYMESAYDIVDAQTASKEALPTLFIGITAERVRDEKYSFRIVLERRLCDADGAVLAASARSAASTSLTPIETVLYLIEEEG